MARHKGKTRFYQPSTSQLAEGRIRRHIAALDLADMTSYRAWCREHGFGVSLRKSKGQLRRELQSAHRATCREIAALARERHVALLGCSDDEEYRQWCDLHHFCTDGDKSGHRYAHEVQVCREERIEAALRLPTMRDLGPDALVEALYAGRKPTEVPDSALGRSIQYTFELAQKTPAAQPALLRLVKRVYAKSRLYQQSLQIGPPLPWPGLALGKALFQLALRHREWVREPETWKPDGRSARRQFGSLVRHLLATYTVPTFLDAAWFEGDGNRAESHRDWFVRIGAGDSVRLLVLPLSLTSRSMHHFLRAPADINITAALRWGQVRGSGGSLSLARAVVGSRLRDVMADEPFWATVIRWFINQPALQAHQIGPIVDYLYQRRYVSTYVVAPDGRELPGGPAEPYLEMKGRTLPALWRRVDAWHEELARSASARQCEWSRCGIEPIQVCWQEFGRDAIALHWSIEELLHTRELQAEGEAMHNCVASYVEECVAGTSSIWSLRVRADRDLAGRRVMTVEIDTAVRAIVQARGRFNRLPGQGKCDALLKVAPEVLRLWALQQDLTIAPGAW